MRLDQIIVCLSVLCLPINGSYAQCDPFTVTIDDRACRDSPISISNTPVGTEEFNWDFCVGDLLQAPSAADVANLGTVVGRSDGIDIIRVGGSYYGFIASFAGRLFRLDFGSSLDTTPTLVDTGLSGLSGAFDISMIEDDGGVWRAYVTSSSRLFRVDFASGITGTPTATDLGGFGGLIASSRGVSTVRDGQDIYVVATSSTNNTLGILRFAGGVTGPATTRSINITGASQLIGVDIARVCDQYTVMATAISSRRLYRVDLGNDPMDPGQTSVTQITEVTGFQSYDISILVEGGDFYLLMPDINGSLVQVDFGNSLLNNPTFQNYGNFGVLDRILGAEFLVDSSNVRGFTYNFQSFDLARVSYANTCLASQAYSEASQPVGVSYSSVGEQKIELKRFDNDGNLSILTETVDVLALPDAGFTTDNACTGENTLFFDSSTSPNGTMVDWSWDFDGLGVSNQQNPSFSFPGIGNFDVTLTSQDNAGCSNTTVIPVRIFDSNDLQPNFSFPAIVCTNGLTQFNDLSNATEDLPQQWSWDFDGLGVSTEQNPSFIFPAAGSYNVSLSVAGFSGCEKTIMQLVNVQAGPIPSFTVDDACQGTLMNFSNGSSGDIVSFSWDFDNGFTSNLENPSLEYSDAGSYNVSLTVENSLGCATTAASLVTVYSNPQVQFSNELSCSQDITQFNDLSTVDNANIVSWRWDFDDPGSGSNSSTDQNATHIFSGPGNFDVELVATSVFGCEDSLTQVIPVLPAPGADFTFDRACIGEPVNFQDTSIPVSGESITSWAWDIAGQFSAEQNPSSTFNVALDYNVTLFVTSENLCVGSTSRVVSIAEAAEVEFGTDFQCENQPVKFFDLTATNGDAVNSWSWDFEGRGQANDSTVFFDFGEVGQFVVDLDILTANGCSYSSQRAVVVNAAPTAAFTPSATFGAPPLEVQFTNESVDASTFLWTFEEGVTSTTIDPSHIYNDLGEFETQLIATNDAQCRDTVSQQILVLLPDLEVELNGLFVVEDGQQSLVLSLTNNGTLRVEEMVARVDLGGNLVVTEIIDQRLDPQQTINYTLNLSITENQLSYICVEIIPAIEGLEDSNPANNSRCEDFSDDGLVVSRPYPNPVTGVIRMNVVTETGQPLTVRLINSTGGLAKSYDLLLRDGFNEINLNVDDLTQGIYFLQIPSLDRVDQVFISR